jgi:hypothetical protein
MKTTIATAILIIICVAAAAEPPRDRNVQPAALPQSTPGSSAQQVRFSRQPVHVGDEIEQTIAIEMRLTLSMHRATQLLGKNQTSIHSNQRRVVTTTEVNDGRASTVKVYYPVATKQVSAANENDLKTNPDNTPQPIQGKTYICRRIGGENGELVITDTAGSRPPSDEYEIVSQQMQMVGRANPLAQFLAGRTVAVGEKLDLPSDVASQIFNLGDRFGKVTRFTLTLQKIESDHGATSAVFQANVDAASSSSTQMRLEIEGSLVLDVASCRAQKFSLIGPIGMSESRGTYSTAYQIVGTGRLQMAIASLYRDARR